MWSIPRMLRWIQLPNSVYVAECGARTKIMVQLCALYTHKRHVIDEGQGCNVLWGDGKLCNFLNPLNNDAKIPTLQIDHELILVQIYRGRVYACVKFSSEVRAIEYVNIHVIVGQTIPPSLPYTIYKNMPISIQIVQYSREVFL